MQQSQLLFGSKSRRSAGWHTRGMHGLPLSSTLFCLSRGGGDQGLILAGSILWRSARSQVKNGSHVLAQFGDTADDRLAAQDAWTTGLWKIVEHMGSRAKVQASHHGLITPIEVSECLKLSIRPALAHGVSPGARLVF